MTRTKVKTMSKGPRNTRKGGRPTKTTPQVAAERRAQLERMVILSDRARSKGQKVSLPTFSWEKSE